MEICARYGQPGSGREEGGRISKKEGGVEGWQDYWKEGGGIRNKE